MWRGLLVIVPVFVLEVLGYVFTKSGKLCMRVAQRLTEWCRGV